MADKQAIINDIRKNHGNMLNIQQLSKVFGCNRKTVPVHVDGLPYYQVGREKKYLAIDIGRRMYDRMVTDQ